jgi:hypothetical protein
LDRLHRAGWSVGEHAARPEVRTQAVAWWRVNLLRHYQVGDFSRAALSALTPPGDPPTPNFRAALPSYRPGGAES